MARTSIAYAIRIRKTPLISSSISVDLRRKLCSEIAHYCGYCQSSEALLGMPLEVEHLIPESAGGQTILENLWLACHRCNQFKSDRYQAIDPTTDLSVPLFNPRTQEWYEHFRWHSNGLTIIGLTESGRATVEALKMNNEHIINTRRYWVMSGWHPPKL